MSYEAYNKGGEYLSYFLTPATVCLAIPLYKQLELLLNNKLAVGASILTGVLGSAGSVLVMAKAFGLNHQIYVTLLPKSITTAIGMGVSEEAGGICDADCCEHYCDRNYRKYYSRSGFPAA